jgi:hypothetical protein
MTVAGTFRIRLYADFGGRAVLALTAKFPKLSDFYIAGEPDFSYNRLFWPNKPELQ